MKPEDGIRVLVVEDEPTVASAIKGVLERSFSADAVIAGDCATARDMLSEDRYDLITLDYQLPDGDGLSLLRDITSVPKHPQVIMVTGQGEERTAVEAFNLGASGYVIKDAQNLFLMLTEAVNSALARTELKKAIDDLRESEKRYRDLFENATDLIQSVNPEGRFLYVNPAWRAALGYEEREIEGLSLFDIIHPDSMEHCTEVFERVMSGERVSGIQAKFVSKDGREILVEGNASVLIEDGRPVATRGIFRDVTVRKRAEEAIRDSEEAFRTIATNANDAIIVIDGAGVITYWNPGAVEVFGYSSDEAIGRDIHELVIPDEYRGSFVRGLAAYTSTGEVGGIGDRLELEGIKKDGTRATVEVSLAGMRIEGRHHVMAIARDISKRKRVEEAIRRSEENLGIILDSIPALIFYKDSENRFIKVNRSLAESMDLNKEDMEGRTCWELFPREQADAFSRDDLEIIESGTAKRNIIEPYDTPEGKRWARTDKIPYRDPDGSIIGVIGFSVDITERIRSEQALRESELRYRELADSLPEVVFETDIRGTITYANQTAFELFGYSGSDLERGIHALEVIAESDRDKVGAAINKMMRGDSTEAVREYLARKKDGTIFPVVVHSSLVLEEGKPAGIRGIITDITERKRAEEALKNSEEKYRVLVENLNEGIWMIDGNASTTYVNDRMAEMLGYAVDEMIGSSLFDFMDEKGKEIADRNMQRRSEGIRERHDFEFIKKDGSRMYATLETSPITGEGGEFKGALAGVIDITDRKRAEEELKMINAELEGFAHTVSHDLRGPLAAVGMASKTLLELLEAPQTDKVRTNLKELGEIIARDVDKSTELIEDLLELAQAGQMPDEVSQIEVSGIVSRILDERDGDIEEKAVEVEVDDDLGRIEANYTQIYQLFSNLIGNALKHNDSERPRIRVSLLGDESGAHRYLVRDNGSGIPPEDLENIFLPFFKGKSGATGIGLSTVKKIIDIYGGDIKAYNDKGACFEFVIKDHGSTLDPRTRRVSE